MHIQVEETIISLTRIGRLSRKIVSWWINIRVCLSSSNVSSYQPKVGSQLTQRSDTTNEQCGNNHKKYRFCQQELGVNHQKDENSSMNE